MLPTVAKQCDTGILRNPFGTQPVIEPMKIECEKCAMVLTPSRTECPNCLKSL